MHSPKIYENKGKTVVVNDKFIYCSSIYLIWKKGASLVEERYYSSSKPIKPKNNKIKKKGYILFRYFELEFAPENWLLRNGYKPLNN